MKKDIHNFTLHHNKNIYDALQKMSKAKSKTLIIISALNKVLGTLSDGDIRRSLMKEKNNLLSKINTIYNKKPISLNSKKLKDTNLQKIFFENRIDIIPVINEKDVLMSVINLYDFFKTNKKIKKNNIPVLIMAGGLGLRMGDITNHIPKPLLPLKGKTIINNIIDNFIKCGFSKFHISLNYKSELILAYFNELNLKVDLNFINENKPLGTAGSLYYLKKYKLENFFVINCDLIINYDYREILKFHNESKNDVTMVLVKKTHSLNYGVCQIDSENNIIDIVEKPLIDNLINSGLYVFNKKILKLIPKIKKFDMNELVHEVLKNKMKIKAYRIDEDSWIDLGDYNKFNNYS